MQKCKDLYCPACGRTFFECMYLGANDNLNGALVRYSDETNRFEDTLICAECKYFGEKLTDQCDPSRTWTFSVEELSWVYLRNRPAKHSSFPPLSFDQFRIAVECMRAWYETKQLVPNAHSFPTNSIDPRTIKRKELVILNIAGHITLKKLRESRSSDYKDPKNYISIGKVVNRAIQVTPFRTYTGDKRLLAKIVITNLLEKGLLVEVINKDKPKTPGPIPRWIRLS